VELLRVEDIHKYFHVREGPFGKKSLLRAVDGVSFAVERDSVFAIVGESGCGKSTLARIIVRLMEPTGGTVFFRGEDIFSLGKQGQKRFRRSVQIIFQDPYASLNPRMRIFRTIAEPLAIHRIVPRDEIRERVAGLLESVGLAPDAMDRYPHEFSGGQRQRICIARALSLEPELIVADEPLSALDVSIQAQVLNLLKDLKERYGLSFVFISHDLNVVHYFSDVVAVMYLGRIVEQARTEELFRSPLHPYTELLLRSAPRIGKKRKTEETETAGGDSDVPSPVQVPPGCPFHPRCPRRFAPCDRDVPRLIEKDGRLVRCHLHG